MSAIALSGAAPPRASSLAVLRRFRAAEPRLFDLGVILLLAMLPTGFAALVDPRVYLDVSPWQKPLKFEFSLSVYLLTLVLFARLLSAGTIGRRWYTIYIAAAIGAIVLEMAWLIGAASMGVASHFNQSAVGAMIYPAMGVLAIVLTSVTAVYAWQIARNTATGLSPAVKESVVWGLALVLPLTLVTAGILASNDGHWVGGERSDAGGLALMGWARDGGDLRVAHFFATHAMHFIPAFGLGSALVLGAHNRLPVRIFAILFTVFVAFTLLQALSGRPFLAFLA